MPDAQPLLDRDPPSVGSYTLLGRLAAGGQGVVYLGRTATGDLVAVKLLHDAWAASTAGRYSLKREVDAARRVAPFCTAQVLDAELTTDPQYIVSEFVDGPPLSVAIEDSGPLVGAALDRLAISTATALVAIHRAGVVHRDLKPDNILLGPDGPRVIDFGIARETSAEMTHTQSLRGTPLYMAPEQFDGRPAGPASDVFAWAATMAFAATGRATFAAQTLAAVMARVVTGRGDLDGVPEPLVGLLRSCLAVDPQRRPTAEAVLNALLNRSGVIPVSVPADVAWARSVTLDPVSGPMPASAPAHAPTPGPTPGPTVGPTVGPRPAPAFRSMPGPASRPMPAPMPAPMVGPGPSPMPAPGPSRMVAPAPPRGTSARPFSPGPVPPFRPGPGTRIPPGPPPGLPPSSPGRRRGPRAGIVVAAVLGLAVLVGGAFAANGLGWFGGATRQGPLARPTRSGATSAATTPAATIDPGSASTPVAVGEPVPTGTPVTTTSPAAAVTPVATPAATTATPRTTTAARTGAAGTTRRPSTAPTTSRSAATGIPAAFGGSWSGPMRQSNPATPRWTGRVVLTAGRPTGRFDAVELGCHGTMSLTRRSGNSLTFTLRLDAGASAVCARSASMTLTLQGARLAARWQESAIPSNYAVGTMTRG